jgi:Type II CAAX prenyl endopeptidase Rce1-like
MTPSLAVSSPQAQAPSAPVRAVSKLRMGVALVGLAALALLGSVPFFLPVMAKLLAAAIRPVPLPLGVVVLLQDVQVLLLVAVAVVVGVRLGPPLGLDAPLVRARLGGQRIGGRLLGLLPVSVLAGTLGAGLVLLLSLAMKGRLPDGLGAFPPMRPWVSATSALYGGIVEELLTRFGLLVLFAFLLEKLGLRRPSAFLLANVAAAVAFGALHLPAAFQLGVPRTPLLIGYLLLANAVVGLLCGWLFGRRGLESAMLAHGSADLWLHVVFPVFGL